MRDALRKARDAKRQRRGQVEPVQNLILYDYQQEMTDKILDAFDAGKERVYGQSPTGSGKTTMMMYIIDKLWRRGNGAQIAAADKERGQVLILVPSIQIASQIQQEAVIILRGQLKHRCRIELEQGESHTDGDADLTVATWQGLHRSDERIINFDPMFFELVIVDECHHAASPCFLRVSQYFHEDVTLEPETTPIDGDRNGHRVKLLGLSATTQRTDGYSVENAFPHYAHEVDMERLMLEKKLTKVLYAAVDGELDIKELLEGGEGDEEENDFDENDDDPFRRCNNRIVKQHILRQSEGGRKYTLVFCKRLKQVWSLKAAFRRKGILAEGITGKTPVNVRGKLLKDFRSGRYPCLINCSTLVEGTDLPCIDLLIIAKPTKSEIQFTQMLGRGLRNSHQTKKLNCLVLDFTVSETTGMQMFGKLFALVTQVDSWPKRRKVVSEEKDNETKSKRDVSQIAPEKKEETSQDFVVAQRKRVHADRDRKRANDGSLIIQPWAHWTTPVSEEPTDLDTGSESDNSVISLPLRCQYGSPGPAAGIIRRIAYYNGKAQEDAADASSAEDVDSNISVKRKDRRLKEESSSFGSMGTIGEVTEAVAWGQESDEEW